MCLGMSFMGEMMLSGRYEGGAVDPRWSTNENAVGYNCMGLGM